MNLLSSPSSSSSSSSSLLSSPSWTCNSCWLFPSCNSPNFTTTTSTTTSAGVSNRRLNYRFRSRCAADSNDPENKGNDESAGTDWDKAWSKFKKAATDNYKKKKTKEIKKKEEMKKKKSIVSNFNPDKYVSWDPRPSDFPLAEEFDPIRRAERSNLMLWTSPKFTLFGAIVIVTALLVYTLVVPQPK